MGIGGEAGRTYAAAVSALSGRPCYRKSSCQRTARASCATQWAIRSGRPSVCAPSVFSPGRATVHSQACERLEESPRTAVSSPGRATEDCRPSRAASSKSTLSRGSHPWPCTAALPGLTPCPSSNGSNGGPPLPNRSNGARCPSLNGGNGGPPSSNRCNGAFCAIRKRR